MTVDMHTVAEKTQRETASMHIITLVTLVFLPGTFLAVRNVILDATAARVARAYNTSNQADYLPPRHFSVAGCSSGIRLILSRLLRGNPSFLRCSQKFASL